MNGELLKGLNARARWVVVQAAEEARNLNHSSVGTEHILLSMVNADDGIGTKALESLGVSLDAVRKQIATNASRGQFAPSGQIGYTTQAKKALELSRREAERLRHSNIGTEHILLGLIRQGDGLAARVLVRLGANLERARQAVLHLRHGYQGRKPPPSPDPLEPWPRKTASEPSPHAESSVVLERFARNLTKQAEAGNLDPAGGWGREVERIMQILTQPTTSPLLVHGVSAGRIAVAEGLAQKLATSEAPEWVRGRQLYYFDAESATTVSADGDQEPQPFLSDFEIVTSIIDEAQSRHDVILFLDNLPTVLGAAGSSLDVHRSLVPMLASRRLRIIGATSLPKYCTYLGNDEALSQLLQAVYTVEPTIAYTIGMLKATLSAATHPSA